MVPHWLCTPSKGSSDGDFFTHKFSRPHELLQNFEHSTHSLPHSACLRRSRYKHSPVDCPRRPHCSAYSLRQSLEFFPPLPSACLPAVGIVAGPARLAAGVLETRVEHLLPIQRHSFLFLAGQYPLVKVVHFGLCLLSFHRNVDPVCRKTDADRKPDKRTA